MNDEKMNNTGLLSFLSIVSLIGTIGNLIVIFVYWKKRDKQTSSFFIIVLSCSDLVVCSVLVPMTAYIESIKFVTQNLIFCKVFHFLTTTIIPSSCLLMIAIAFDRYFCICMASRNVMTLPKAKTIVICLIIVSCLLGIIPSLAAIINLENSSTNGIGLMDNKTFTNFSSSSSSTCTLIDSNSNMTLFYFINLASLINPFKYCYDLIFLVTILIITVLYILIYSEIYTRRKMKRKRKHKLMLTKWMNGRTNNNKTKEIDLKEIKNNEINEDIEMKVDLIVENNNEEEEEKQIENNNNNNFSIAKTDIDLKEESEFKRKVNVISAKDVRTAFMLFVISFLFILFFLPSLIYTYRALLQMNSKSGSEITYDEPNLILTYLYFSNSAINPIIYCFLNPNFRADLIKFFFKRGSLFNNCMKRFSNE